MKIAIGADHAGFELKQKIHALLENEGHQITDEGTIDNNSVDYPDFARKVAHDVTEGRADFGVLVCGSGIGMAIAANKVPGIRAANVCNATEAQLSREHNDANVVAIGARLVDEGRAKEIIQTFLNTPFAGGRHERRIEKITELEHQAGR
jgi:ribose 5-phosphate isomerase B